MIVIYQDYIHNNGVLLRRLQDALGPDKVRLCDADDIIGGALQHARLLVMPGGADLYNCEKLNGAGNAAIRAFVEAGGAYLGICAGAYYGCREIVWAEDKEQEIRGARELSFFDGIATGPAYEFIEDGNIRKSWNAAVTLQWDETEATVLYQAGPVFEDNGNATVLARYSDLPGAPPAVIECAIGQGKAILCSPHLEYDAAHYRRSLYRHNNPSYERETAVAAALAADEAAQNALWRTLLDRACPDINRTARDAA